MEWSVPYAAMALALDQPCPLLKHEKDDAGNVQEAYKHKANWTCWQAMRKGEPFCGKRPIFGQLVYYLDDKQHTLEPRTSPGIFVGWKLETGMRYRGVLIVADYDLLYNCLLYTSPSPRDS